MLQPGEYVNGHAHQLDAPSRLRPATEADIPWLVALAIEKYPSKVRNSEGATLYLREVIRHPGGLVVRGERSAVVALYASTFFDPDARHTQVLFFAGDIWEVVMLLRMAARWAKAKGCGTLRFSDDTGRSIKALARRLGAKRETVAAYLLET